MSLDQGYDPRTGSGPGDPYGFTGSYPSTPQQTAGRFSADPSAVLNDPQLRGALGQIGYNPEQSQYDRSLIQADMAYNQALAALGDMGGGSAMRNPFLDELERLGISADRSYLGTQSTLANRGQQQADKMFDLTRAGYGTQQAQGKLKMAGMNVQEQGLQDQLGLIKELTGLDLKGVDLQRQDVQSALRQLGLDRQSLGLQDQGLDIVLQQLGLNRGAAQQSATTQLRGNLYDATARGAGTSQGFGEAQSDVKSNLQRALEQIGLQEGQVGLQRGQLGLQGQRLTEQEGGYGRDLDKLGLQEQRIGIQSGAQTRDLDRQLKQLGLDRQSLGLSIKDYDRLKEIINVQQTQSQQQTYGELARINNAQEHLNLQEQGIGVAPSVGGGGSANPAALQGLAGLLRGQAQLEAISQRDASQFANAYAGLSPGVINQLFGNTIGGANPSTQQSAVFAALPRLADSDYGVPQIRNTSQAYEGYNPNYYSPLGGGGREY